MSCEHTRTGCKSGSRADTESGMQMPQRGWNRLGPDTRRNP
jgi:hypothetical protein